MADSTPRNESVTEAVPKSLGKYLVDNVEGLQEYYDEFPAPNRTMNMPCVSILFQNPEFTAQANPSPVDPVSPGSIVASKARVKWIVGQYDGQIQLDLWARNKEERDDLTDALFNALNPDISPMGLTLVLDEYFGVLCDYLYVRHDFEDTEVTSQTDEWRTTFTLLVTCKAVRERKEFIIEQSELQLQTAPESGTNFTDA